MISECSQECKRCYSSSNNDCYECRLGYAIYGKRCKVRTGYFLKTPPDKDVEEIPVKTLSMDPYFDITVENILTVTIYIKFFGIKFHQHYIINSVDCQEKRNVLFTEHSFFSLSA